MAKYTLDEHQREIVEHALVLYEDQSKKLRKKNADLGYSTNEQDEALAVLKGDGVDHPGLLRIFAGTPEPQMEMADDHQGPEVGASTAEPEPEPEEEEDDGGEALFATTLEDLSADQQLSNRTINALAPNITTIAELVTHTEEELMSISGFGAKAMEEVNGLLIWLEQELGREVELGTALPPEEPVESEGFSEVQQARIKKLVEEHTYEELLAMADDVELDTPGGEAIMAALERMENTEAEAAEADGEVLPDDGDASEADEPVDDEDDTLPFDDALAGDSEEPAEEEPDEDEPKSVGDFEVGEVVIDKDTGFEGWIVSFRVDTGEAFIEDDEEAVVAKVALEELGAAPDRESGIWIADKLDWLGEKPGAPATPEEEAQEAAQAAVDAEEAPEAEEEPEDEEWPAYLLDKPASQRVCLSCFENYNKEGACPECGDKAPWAGSAA